MLSKLFSSSSKIFLFGKSQSNNQPQLYSSTVKRIYEPNLFSTQNNWKTQNISNFSTLKNKANEFKKSIENNKQKIFHPQKNNLFSNRQSTNLLTSNFQGEKSQNFSTRSRTNSPIKANVLGSQTKEIKEWWNEKTFENATREEVQGFFARFNNGIFKDYQEIFKGLDGKALINMTETQFLQKVNDKKIANELFNQIVPWWTRKKFENATKEEVQEFFEKFNNGMLKNYREKFNGLDGKVLINMTEKQFKQKVDDEKIALVLFNEIVAWWTKKTFENATTEEVQQFFEKFKNGMFKDYQKKFNGLDGNALINMTEPQFNQRVNDEKIANELFNQIVPWWTRKKFENATKEEVQEYFEKFNNGIFKDYREKFNGFDGNALINMTETQFNQQVDDKEIALVLFNEIVAWWTKKPFEKGTTDEVQTFFQTFDNGRYKEDAPKFVRLIGKDLIKMTKEDFKDIAKDSGIGIALFNDVQTLKKEEITLEFMVKLQLDKNKSNVGSPLLKPEGKDVPLVGRTETMKSVLNKINNRRRNFLNKLTNRKANKLSVLTSVPQIGKTRLLQEIPNYISDPSAFPKLDESFYPIRITKDRFIPLLVTFQNGANVRDFEAENPDFYFALRMLHRYFLENNGIGLSAFFAYVQKSCYQFLSVEIAYNIIIDHFRTTNKLSPDEPVLLYLAVDEFQKPFGYPCKKPDCKISLNTHSYLRHIVESCGALSCRFDNQNQIFPILAGVEENVWGSVFESSGYAREPIGIELVSATKFFDLIANEKMIVDEVKIPKILLQNTKFRQNMILLSGIPGAIVDFLTELTELNKQNNNWNNIKWQNALKAALASTPGQRITHQPISFQDLARSILQVPVDEDEYSDKQKTGLLLLQSERIVLPFLSIYRFQKVEKGASKKEQIIQKAIIANLNSIWEIISDFGSDWQRWEWFGANFYALKYNCHLLLGTKELTFGEFHNGAKMNQRLASKIIQLGDEPLIFEKILPPPFSSSSTSFGTPKLNLENHHKVFQVEGQEGIDFFSILSFQSTNRQENHLFLDLDQRKAMSTKIGTTGLAEIITKAKNQVPKGFENDWAIGVFNRQFEITTEDKRKTKSIDSIEQDILEHCYFVGSNEFANYYGTSFFQIASLVQKVNFNDPLVSKAAMASCMSGIDSKELNKIAELLIKKRKKQQLSLQVCKEILKNVDGKNYSERVEFNTSKISWTFEDEIDNLLPSKGDDIVFKNDK